MTPAPQAILDTLVGCFVNVLNASMSSSSFKTIHELEKKTLAVHLVIHTVHYCHQAFQPLHALLIANLNITLTTLKDFVQLPVRYHLGPLQTQNLGQVSSPSPNKLLPEDL